MPKEGTWIYNASPRLERITAALLAINAADDERNPPETGIMERELKRVKNGKLLLIPASDETRGHAATGMAKFYKRELMECKRCSDGTLTVQATAGAILA